jgi:hypothetical protein
MKNKKNIIGIDVYRSRYDACFYDVDTNRRKYYTGSLSNGYGKARLINRINEENRIIINESLLAAELMIRFPGQVILVNDEIISLLGNAKIPRGKKMAAFFIKNFRTNKAEKLSKKMIGNLLIEGEKHVNLQEKIFDDGVDFFDNIIDGKKVDYEKILDLEEASRKFNSHSDVQLNKVEEVERVIEKFEKLNDLFDD